MDLLYATAPGSPNQNKLTAKGFVHKLTLQKNEKKPIGVDSGGKVACWSLSLFEKSH